MWEIVAQRPALAADGLHMHVDLVGYLSPHIAREPIMLAVERVLQRMALGETFVVVKDGEPVPVKPGACEVCAFEPALKTEKDPPKGNLILDLPQL